VPVLLGQHGPDQPDQGVTGGEDPDHVGPGRISPVQPFLGVVRPDLAPQLLRKGGEREHVCARGVEMGGRRRQLLARRVEDPVELGVHRHGVGLVVDRVQHARTHGQDDFGVAD
jgi:hypothetical protein